ncbi:MAG: hypothetical protein Q8K79_06290 [Solirubrobacteraceae bacterium]|nr:hypothetical protein [Solirubrobacteraceae bacterium]
MRDHDSAREEVGARDRRRLAALADGSLSPRRAERMRRRVARSPRLATQLAAQRDAVGAVRALADEPSEGLRARVERERARHRRPRRRSLSLAAAAVATAALAAIALVVLPAGAGDPTVLQAATLAHRPARAAAPAPLPGRPALLDRQAEGLAFPDWEEKFGWRATGARVDQLEGRRATTVFYENPRGARIGYTIVAGDPLDAPDGARAAVREGVHLRSVRRGGRIVVTWLRDGHTCVLSGEGIGRDALLDLAGWRAKGAIAV